MNVGIFAVISHVGGYDDHLWSITDYRGLAYRSPVLAGAMAFFLLSLIGIPFTGGFFAKFYVFSAALQKGMFGLAIIGLINSGIAAFYYLRLLTALYSKPAEGSPVLAVPRMSVTLGFAILLAASATLLLGIVPRSSLDLAQRGASTFFAADPHAATSIRRQPSLLKGNLAKFSLALQAQVPSLKDLNRRFEDRSTQHQPFEQTRAEDQPRCSVVGPLSRICSRRPCAICQPGGNSSGRLSAVRLNTPATTPGSASDASTASDAVVRLSTSSAPSVCHSTNAGAPSTGPVSARSST